MCIRDSEWAVHHVRDANDLEEIGAALDKFKAEKERPTLIPVSYTHLRAHETVLDLVCRLLLEKKKQ